MLTKQQQLNFLKSHRDTIRRYIQKHPVPKGQVGSGFFGDLWSGVKSVLSSPIVKEISRPIFDQFVMPYIKEKLKGSSGGSLKLSGAGKGGALMLSGAGKKKIGNTRIPFQPAVQPRMKRGSGLTIAGVR